MASQLEVVRFRDLIAVNEITRVLDAFEEPTIEIRGEDFSAVESVLVNEIRAPEFIVVNKSTMWVQLPQGAQDALNSIQVVSADFTKTARASLVLFQIGDKSRKVDGILKLSQLFMKWVLQSPGSDIFDPLRGGGLQNVIGKTLSASRMEPVRAELTQAVDRTASQIRTAQASVNIPLSEKLLSANILDLKIFDTEMRANLRVRVLSMLGESAVSSVDL